MIELGLSLGFILGLRHAFEPDHLTAVSTQIVKEEKKIYALKHSLAWGLGHGIVLLLGGMILLMLELTLPPTIESVIELLIGIVLVILGFSSLKERRTISTKKTFMIGSAHGLAGSSALVLLITTSFTTVSERLGYIIIFGIGSMMGMLIVAGMLCLFQEKKGVGLQRTAAVMSIAVGVGIIVVKGAYMFHSVSR